jgi:lipopolysaccharide exporter
VTVAADEEPFWRTRAWWVRAGHTSAGVFAATALGFVATLAAARTLSVGGFGALELAVVAVGAVVTLLDISLEEAVIFRGARARAAGHPAALRALLRTSLRIDIAIGVAVAALLLLIAPWFADIVSDGSLAPALVRLAALEALLVTANGTTGAVLVVCDRAHLRAWSMAVANAARLLAVLIAAAVEPTAVGVLTGFVVGSGIGAAFQAVLAWRVVRKDVPAHSGSVPVEPAPTRGLIAFGSQSSLTTTLIAIRVALVSVAIGRSLGPAAVGIFAVALFPVTVVDVASSPFRLLTLPEQSLLAARGRRDVVWHGLVAYSKAAIPIGLVGAAVGWFVLPSILPALYGESYRAAIDPSRALIVAAVASLSVVWAKGLPAALGRPGVRTLMTAGEVALTAIALLVVPRDDVASFAWAVSAVAAVMAIAWWLAARRILARVPDPGARA